MGDIKVSVCMITYNHERYIAQAVESVLAQNIDFPVELVIGEDVSTDRTREIVQELAQQHPDRIRLRLSDRNMGGKANFLATIALCRGQYVAMLEGDDYWTDANKLQRQVDALDAHPEWAICFHPCACMYEDGMQGIPVYPLSWTKPVATIEDLFSSNFLPTSSVVFRNRLFATFPQWFRDLVIGDWPLHILNAAHGDIGFIPDVMSAYRVHRGGVWSSATHAEQIIYVFELFSAVDHHFGGKYTKSINAYRADTVRWVMSQLDAATSRLTEATEQGRQQLRSEYSQLQASYAVLEQSTRSLQAFYDTWTKSILYRVEREIRRPFRRLSRYLQSRAQGTDETKMHEPPISKAA